MRTMFTILFTYKQAFLQGLFVTLKLVLIVWAVGLTVGIVLGFLADRHKKAIGIPVFASSFILSGIPILVLLYWAHFPLQQMLNQVIDPFYTACWVLALVNIFAVTDAVKNALGNFPQEYGIAARVCGMSGRDIALKIKFPIILRQLIPVLLSTQVVILQASLFASLISVNEIFRVCQQVNASAYKPVQIYTALALFFLAICLPINGLALWLKARYTRDFSER